MTIRVGVVDDEPLAREGIRDLLAGEDGVRVVGECRNGPEAVQLVEGGEVDLLFLDVQMPGMDGFQVLRESERLPPAIVFVTAYDEYAVRAFEVHAVDYLLKPVRPERFREALERVRRRLARHDTERLRERFRDLLSELRTGRSTPDRLPVRERNGTVLVSVDDIRWVEAAGNYAELHTVEGSHLIRMTMTELADRLEPSGFVRIHRSYIVRLDRVASIRPWSRGDHLVVLKGGTELPLTRTYRPGLEEKLGHGI